jgi:hypothetical protein
VTLLAEKSVKQAAEGAEVDRGTVHRRMREPVFQATLNARRAESRQTADDRLLSLQGKALQVVESALTVATCV